MLWILMSPVSLVFHTEVTVNVCHKKLNKLFNSTSCHSLFIVGSRVVKGRPPDQNTDPYRHYSGPVHFPSSVTLIVRLNCFGVRIICTWVWGTGGCWGCVGSCPDLDEADMTMIECWKNNAPNFFSTHVWIDELGGTVGQNGIKFAKLQQNSCKLFI